MKKFIQYVGCSQDVYNTIVEMKDNNTMMIDLTGDMTLQEAYPSYFTINPLVHAGNIKAQIDLALDGDKKDTYIINDCHLLNKDDLEPLIALYRKGNINLIMFSNNEPLDLEISEIRRLSHNEPLPYYDYSLNLKK